MLYRTIILIDINALADHLGIDRSKFDYKTIQKRKCPNCVSFDHTFGSGKPFRILPDREYQDLTAANCHRYFWLSRLHPWQCLRRAAQGHFR
jgi:hypothetical protein